MPRRKSTSRSIIEIWDWLIKSDAGLWCNHDGCRSIANMETTHLEAVNTQLERDIDHLQRLLRREDMDHADVSFLVKKAQLKLVEIQQELRARNDSE